MYIICKNLIKPNKYLLASYEVLTSEGHFYIQTSVPKMKKKKEKKKGGLEKEEEEVVVAWIQKGFWSM